jgi:asparagine synthase (glutamine-hydrolysing)
VLANGQWTQKIFWSHPVPTREKTNLTEWHDLFVKTVEDHIQSDAPLATTLSGGLDSNAINGVIAKILGRSKDLNAFSVIAPDTANESELIDYAVKDLGINHHYIDIGDVDMESALDEMLAAHDEPTITAGQVNQFIFRRAVAEQGYKVLLVGEGADEILAGYAKIIPSYLADLGNADEETMKNFVELSGISPTEMFAQAEKLKATGIGRRAIQTTLFGYDLLNPKQDTSDTALQFEKSYANVKPGIPGFYTYRELMDRLTIDIPQVLRNEDRNSMAHGIESRPVFLDHRLFELSWQYSFERLMENGENKSIMRQALKNEIPAAVLNNRKKFRRPGSITDLVYNRLQSPLRSLLNGPAFADKTLWNPDMPALFERDLAAANFDHAFIWLRVYMFARIAALRFGV